MRKPFYALAIGLSVTALFFAAAVPLVGQPASTQPAWNDIGLVDKVDRLHTDVARLQTNGDLVRADLDRLQGVSQRFATHSGWIEFRNAGHAIFGDMTRAEAQAVVAETAQVPAEAVPNSLGLARVDVTHENRDISGAVHRSWTFKIPFPANFPRENVEVSILPSITRLQTSTPGGYVLTAERAQEGNAWNLTFTLINQPVNSEVNRIQISWIAIAVARR